MITGDILDPTSLRDAFRRLEIDAVFHFAALTSVPDSVANPLAYYHNNVAGSLNLARAMVDAGVARLIFSSTAAVYGDPREVPIPETHPTEPCNPYERNATHGQPRAEHRQVRAPSRLVGLSHPAMTIPSTAIATRSGIEIVESASENNVDLIVMATHGRTGFAHALIGSVRERAPSP